MTNETELKPCAHCGTAPVPHLEADTGTFIHLAINGGDLAGAFIHLAVELVRGLGSRNWLCRRALFRLSGFRGTPCAAVLP